MRRFFLIPGFILMTVMSFSSFTAYAQQAVNCPGSFTLQSETDANLVCLFEGRLTSPPESGQDPRDTVEGRALISSALDACASVSGVPSALPSSANSVFVQCSVAKPESTDPPITDPVNPPDNGPIDNPPPASNPDPIPTVPENVDFDTGDAVRGDPLVSGIANSLARVCNDLVGRESLSPAGADLLDRCRDINAERSDLSQLNALQKLAARQYADVANLISFQNVISVGDIGGRLGSMRSAMEQNTRDVAAAHPAHPAPGLLANVSPTRQRGGAAGDDSGSSVFERFGAFLYAADGRGDKSTTALSQGFDYSSSSLTIGADYLVNRSTVVGLALGQGSSESLLAEDSGLIDIETMNVSIYASKYFNNGWFIDAIIGKGEVDTRNQRKINFIASGTSIDQTAFGEFNSDQTIISFGVGRSFNRYVDIDLSARFNYIDTEIGRFAEATNSGEAGFGLALEIDSYDINSVTSDISASFSKPFSQSWGVLLPRATVRWLHEFDNGDEELLGRFLTDDSSFNFQQSGVALGSETEGSTIFSIPLEQVDSNYGNLSVGLTALFTNQISVNVGVSRTIGLANFSHSIYSLTLRRDFD